MQNTKQTAKEKKWIIKSTENEESKISSRRIANDLKINPILARILYNRGYTDTKSAANFITMSEEMLSSPFDMADMDKAVARIQKALSENEKITVYGDYDVDGVTSVCTLYLYLKSCGAKVDYYIPNRAGEGYGVTKSAIDMIAENGTKLIITVDTGVTATEEVEYAHSCGVDFLITDHHECHAELPSASAVINPHRPDCKYPFKELAGVGVVFKLICAHYERINKLKRMESTLKILREYADLVAIGTIADVMPIVGENRIIVKYGLKMIENTKRIGLESLIAMSTVKAEKMSRESIKRRRKPKITSSFIGYTLAPRINAAGRVRSASVAVELFLANDEDTAYEIAEQLCAANRERQAEENKIMLEAYEKIEQLDIEKNPVIVIENDTWHHGVIGIVSSRITEKYARPSILVSFDGNSPDTPYDEHVGKGSGRSIKGMNLVDALVSCSDELVKYGGHELAAGLSVSRSKLSRFKEKINEYARNALTEQDMLPTLEADMEIGFDEASISLAEALGLLEPYGVGNPMPMFVLRNATVYELASVGEGKHTKITLGNSEHSVVAMCFSTSVDSLNIYTGDCVDLLFSISINEWMERKSVQLIVKDIRAVRSSGSRVTSEEERFNEVRLGGVFTESEDILPKREDFVAVYKLIQTSSMSGVRTLTHREILSKLSLTSSAKKIGYIKLKFIIMVFKELNLIGIEENEDEVYTFNVQYSVSKKNLDKSSILRKLRSQMR